MDIQTIKNNIEAASSYEELVAIQSDIFDQVMAESFSQDEANPLTDRIKKRAEEFGYWF